MSQRKRVGALEIHEDQKFQERAWLVQRIGWALMFLVLLAALAGIFGGGYLSRVTAESENLKIEYDRFPRRLGTTMAESTGYESRLRRFRPAVARPVVHGALRDPGDHTGA